MLRIGEAEIKSIKHKTHIVVAASNDGRETESLL